jgi:hypothetical protein
VYKADNLPPADVTESVSLNLPEPSGPHWPVMGMFPLYLLYFLLFTFISINVLYAAVLAIRIYNQCQSQHDYFYQTMESMYLLEQHA